MNFIKKILILFSISILFGSCASSEDSRLLVTQPLINQIQIEKEVALVDIEDIDLSDNDLLAENSSEVQNTKGFGFEYGFLLRPSSNPEQIVALEDSAVVYTGDDIRINAHTADYFYVIYIDSNNEYIKIPPESNETPFITPLSWSGLNDETGWETFYLISSKEKLADLEKNFSYYDKSKGKVRERFQRKIQDILDGFSPKSRDLKYFSSNLEKPILGGVTLRGDDDNSLNQYHLTHNCSGKDGIAIKKIVLNHQNKE